MTTEDIDLNMSIAFEKLALTPQALKDSSDHEPMILKAIKEIRIKKKRPDVNSIYDFVANNGASNVNEKFIQTLIDNLIQKDKILNRKTPEGLDSFYINSSPSPVASFVESPASVETPKRITSSIMMNGSDTSMPYSDIATNTPILKDNFNNYVRNEVFDTFYEDYLEFKHYMNDTIKSITPGNELVTNLLDDNASLQSKIDSLERVIESLRSENRNLRDDTKTYLNIIENLSKSNNIHLEDSNTDKNKSNLNYKNGENNNKDLWQIANSRQKHVKTTNESNRKSNNIHFELSNTFSPLYHEGQTLATSNLLPNTIKDCSDKKDKNIMSQNIVRKRPPIVINNFPENQTVFPKIKIVPGELPFSDAVKNKATNPLNDAVKNKTTNPTIKFFSDSIAKGIRLREFNQYVKSGKARMHCFPEATSAQLLHYLDVNLDHTTDTVILHIGINDLLQDMAYNNNNLTDNSIKNFMKNIEQMVQKCRSFGVKRVFLSGITITTRISCQKLEEIHEQLVSLCEKINIIYIDNRNIFGVHLFKDGLHLLESVKQILAKNFIFNLNNFLCQTQQPIVMT